MKSKLSANLMTINIHLIFHVREEASLREREAKVRKDMRRRNRDKEYAMKNAMREEAVRAFQTLLIDLVRTHEVRLVAFQIVLIYSQD